MARVSVIITCFNLEQYIAEAIESVLSQTFDEPVEIIVVDDCSTDRSCDVIADFNSVKLFRTEENGGVLLAMLKGLEEAEGDLIFLLDGDDRWGPDKLSRVVAAFDADPRLAFATHDLAYIDGAGKLLDRTSRVSEVMGGVTQDTRGRLIRDGILTLGDYVWLGSAIGLRRNLTDLEGFATFARSLPDPRNTYQDWPLAMWLASRLPDSAFGYVDAKLFDYRLHTANYSGDAATVEKARRNVVRARNTTAAMLELAPTEASRRTLRQRLSADEMAVAIYKGRGAKALAHFWRAIPHFVRRRGLAKETARLVMGLLLGPERTVSAINRLRRSET